MIETLLKIQTKVNEISNLLLSISDDIDEVPDKELQDKLAEAWIAMRQGKGSMSIIIQRTIREGQE